MGCRGHVNVIPLQRWSCRPHKKQKLTLSIRRVPPLKPAWMLLGEQLRGASFAACSLSVQALYANAMGALEQLMESLLQGHLDPKGLQEMVHVSHPTWGVPEGQAERSRGRQHQWLHSSHG